MDIAEHARKVARRWAWPYTSVERAWLKAMGSKARKKRRRRERSKRRAKGYEPTRGEVRDCMEQRHGVRL